MPLLALTSSSHSSSTDWLLSLINDTFNATPVRDDIVLLVLDFGIGPLGGGMAHGNADCESMSRIFANRTAPGPLVVMDVPGNRYYITDYDGQESVMTPDTIKWISFLDGCGEKREIALAK